MRKLESIKWGGELTIPDEKDLRQTRHQGGDPRKSPFTTGGKKKSRDFEIKGFDSSNKEPESLLTLPSTSSGVGKGWGVPKRV